MALWAVLTAIIVTQMSVGQSLKAAIDYVAGTIGGAIYGAIVGILVGHDSEVALLAGLAIAVGPLALIAAIRPSLAAAPITAATVLVVPILTHATPIASAVDRVLEVALGAVIGLTISFVLFPSSAYGLAIEGAARMLERLADAVGELMAGLKEGLEVDALHRIQDGIGEGADATERSRRRGGARARGATFDGAGHGPPVAYAAQIAPRPCNHRPRRRFALATSVAGATSTRSRRLRWPSVIFFARAGPRFSLGAFLPASIAWNWRSTPMRRQSPRFARRA